MACATNPWRIGYSRAAIQIFLIAFFALNAVFACLYATGLFTSEALEKQKEEIVHLWQSCIYNRFAHIHRFQHPFLRPETCSELTMAAAKRGEAGLKRARYSRVPGYYHPDIVDGCASSEGSADSTDFSGRSTEGCQLEWVVYSTECGVNLNRLAKLCHVAGIPLAVVGLKTMWRGFGGRLRIFRDYLHSLPADRVVIVSDADDVFVLPAQHCRPVDIIHKFLDLGSPMVFGSEKYCFPDWWIYQDFYPKPSRDTPFKYVNAGTYMGYAWAIASAIDAAYIGDCLDDQRQFMLVFLGQDKLFKGLPRAPTPFTHGQKFSRVKKPPLATPSLVLPSPPSAIESSAARSSLSSSSLSSISPELNASNVPRFIQLDYFNSIFHLLGGFGAEALEIEGDGRGGRREMRVRSKFTGGEACVFHQQGNKTGDLAMFDVFNVMGMEVLFD
ncbi:unnamed protein product [Closterium sp. Yama58-4]|nr:unnamed protein product [Closterium sp. Yama58-4]